MQRQYHLTGHRQDGRLTASSLPQITLCLAARGLATATGTVSVAIPLDHSNLFQARHHHPSLLCGSEQ